MTVIPVSEVTGETADAVISAYLHRRCC